jgi:hypothetical protein
LKTQLEKKRGNCVLAEEVKWDKNLAMEYANVVCVTFSLTRLNLVPRQILDKQSWAIRLLVPAIFSCLQKRDPGAARVKGMETGVIIS